jgi:hypothetical protein
MYVTICAISHMWEFVIAEGIACEIATDEIRELLENIALDDLQSPDIFARMSVLVEIEPEDDLLPARSRYEPMGDGVNTGPRTTGLHPISRPDGTLWYTLADAILSKMATHKAPRIRRALRFTPQGIQPDLRPVDLMGDARFRFDPSHDDLYMALLQIRRSSNWT